MLLVDIISTRASSCASSDSGTCTAIWSPSKSALNAAQTKGCSWIALPSISTGSNAWMPRRCSVGARFKQPRDARGSPRREYPRPRDALFRPASSPASPWWTDPWRQARIDERLEQFERHLLRQTALMQPQFRDRPRSPNGRNSRRACRAGSCRKRPCLPLSMSASDFSGACWAPVMTRPRRPLSTVRRPPPATCAFRCGMMMSGARSSISRFKRLLRLMTRR